MEQILDRVLPEWKTTVDATGNLRVNRWVQHREAVQRADASLARDAEVRERLGDNAPLLSAGAMHPWVWEGARALWRSGHFREAVTAAAGVIVPAEDFVPKTLGDGHGAFSPPTTCVV
ncbi:hypothetical protein ACFWWM_37305 [Streptomyces sp. NPDC058682]|uniref:hypothetical protein n=1 Tax=Streptomyces sp. NPDC058682 TaxID=3346596 RepID=UPI003650F6DD